MRLATDQQILILKNIFFLIYKTSYLNVVVDFTDASLSVRVPWIFLLIKNRDIEGSTEKWTLFVLFRAVLSWYVCHCQILYVKNLRAILKIGHTGKHLTISTNNTPAVDDSDVSKLFRAVLS
jgi:hypothetical protein